MLISNNYIFNVTLNFLFKQAPVEIEPWTEVKQTINDTSRCMQVRKGVLMGSEDCLYLNVFTPVVITYNWEKS